MEIDIKEFKNEEVDVDTGDFIEFMSGDHLGIIIEECNKYNILLINNEMYDVFFDYPVELERIKNITENVIRKKGKYKIILEEI